MGWDTSSGRKSSPESGALFSWTAHPVPLRRHLCYYSMHSGHRSFKTCLLFTVVKLNDFFLMCTGGNSMLKAKMGGNAVAQG